MAEERITGDQLADEIFGTMKQVTETTPQSPVGDEFEITWGEESYTPIPYNTFKIGPFSTKIKVLPGETHEAAFKRGYLLLENLAKNSFKRKRQIFANNIKENSK